MPHKNINSFNPINPWDHLTRSQYESNKSKSLTKEAVKKRIQSAVLGTFYDLGMIPVNVALATVKTPVATIRAVVLFISPKVGQDFLKNWDGKSVVLHLYRAASLVVIVVVNPFISLVNPDKALNFHLNKALIPGDYKKELQQSLEKRQQSFQRKLSEFENTIDQSKKVEETLKTIEELDTFAKEFNSYQLEQIPAAVPFCTSFEKQLSNLQSKAIGKKDEQMAFLLKEAIEINKQNEEYQKLYRDHTKLASDTSKISQRALETKDLMTVFECREQVEGTIKFIEQDKDKLKPEHYEDIISRAQSSLTTIENQLEFLQALKQAGDRKIEEWKSDIEIRNLFENILKLRNEKKADSSLKTNPDHLLARKIAKGQFAIKLGVGLKSIGKGVHGAKLVKSVNGKELGVFKPQELPGEKSSDKSFFHKLKNIFGQGQEQFLNDGVYADTCAEKAAYILAQELNCQELTVSPVKIVDFEDRTGAFLVFAKKTKEAAVISKELQEKQDYTEEELNIFQSFAIYDYLLGNLDRHDRNWLVEWENNKMKKIVPIDNANSLPKGNPTLLNYGAWRSLYAWKSYKIAEIPFTEKMKEFVQNNITSEKIESIIEKIENDSEISDLYKNEQRGHFLSEESKEGLRRRAEVLRKIVAPAKKEMAVNGAKDQIKSPFSLAHEGLGT